MNSVHNESLLRKLRRLLVRILVASATPLPDDREAIWSIPGNLSPDIHRRMRSDSFGHCAGGDRRRPRSRMARESASEFAAVGVGAAIGSLIAMQGVAIIVSLYHIITNRFTMPAIEKHRKQGREEGITEGMEKSNQAWREWLRRREEADAEGRPFDEPPPDQRDTQR